jgi:beta-glucosidase
MPSSPLYPFGYGLSYTTFKYSNLRLEGPIIRAGGTSQVQVDVANTGDRDGVETVQLYLHERFAPVSTSYEQLRGFERVDLKPGETKTVTFTLTPDDLMLLDLSMHWKVVPGVFDIMVGRSSSEILLRSTLGVQGERESTPE